jgi:SAM-dependent methyltransferase
MTQLAVKNAQETSTNLYDYPIYYDLVFGSDWEAELRFLQRVFKRFVAGKTRSVFEPACGTGRLVYRLARAGFDVTGLDLNSRAVEFCRERLKRHGLRGDVWVGDMSAFQLKKPVDAAFNTINSFRHLLTQDQAKAHLQCMARAVRPGGIYVLGMHLTPTKGNPTESESWAARRGNLSITTTLTSIERDMKNRKEHCRMVLDVYKPTEHFQIIDELQFRTYTARQLRDLLTFVPEFAVAQVFDFRYQIEQPQTIDDETEDVVLILQRR